MKKMEMAVAVGVMVFALSACGQEKDLEGVLGDGSVSITPTETVGHTNSETKENGTAHEGESVTNPQEGNMPERDDTGLEGNGQGVEDIGSEGNGQGVKDTGSEGNGQEVGDTGSEGNGQEVGGTGSESNMPEVGDTGLEADGQGGEDTGLKATADELFDSFINGSISAVKSTDLTSTFYITDLDMDSGEWDSYSVGERVDLDNDGEDELIICGPYGGIYLDARDNKVYEFAAAGGTALVLSYTYYNGAVWIMYSNKSSAGFEFYHMEKFEGADNLVAEMNFGEEFDINNAEAGLKYTWNGAEISYDEYTQLCSKIFAAEETTYVQN